MKIGFSTNAFTSFSLPDALRAIARAGYQGVEIMADAPHAWPPHMTEARIAETRSVLAESRLAISNVNSFMMKAVGDFWHPSWVEKDKGAREARFRHTVDSLKMAQSLGAHTVSTEAGGPLDGLDRETARKWFDEGILHLLDIAEHCCVKLLIESEPGLYIENPEQVEDFFMRFRSPWLGLNFDVGHFFCVGADIRRAIRRFAPDIGHVHIEDIAADRKHHHLIPGRGAIDFGEVFDALRSAGYDGWVTVELYTEEANPVEAALAALKHLKPFIK
jgi:sugar phosphate isomerase/epimerase